MTHLETSWYEHSYATTAGVRDTTTGRRNSGATTTTTATRICCFSDGWWHLYLQALTAGVSAGVTYHLLEQFKLKRRISVSSVNDADASLPYPDPPPKSPRPSFKTDEATNIFSFTPYQSIVPLVKSAHQTLCNLPTWFWASAPAYLGLFLPKPNQSWILLMGSAAALYLYGCDINYNPRRKRDDSVASHNNDGDDGKTSKVQTNRGGDNVDAGNDIFPHPSERSRLDKMDTTTSSAAHICVSTSTTRFLAAVGNQKRRSPHKKYLELLVHNISHTDLVLGLSVHATESNDNDSSKKFSALDGGSSSSGSAGSPYFKNYIRPRFSSFDLFCRLVLDHVQKGKDGTEKKDQVIYFPRYQRSMDDPRFSIREHPADSDPPLSPTGLKLAHPAPLPPHNIHDNVRIRESDQAEIIAALKDKDKNTAVQISHVFFPLLATLLPVWHRQIAAKEYRASVKRVLILVTGVGTPRNWTHSVKGNSTEACADLMIAFLANIDPGLTVVQIHSDTNIFRCDENLLFVERELMPTIHAYRDAHATGTPYPDELEPSTTTVKVRGSEEVAAANFDDSDWRTSMHVTVSFADGSPARTHAIQTSLRSYRPTYFHFWQLKTFWHESKVVDDDIEVHSFETMETLPAVDVDRLRDPGLQAVIQEMRAFYHQMTTALTSGNNDIHRFWLRKTHKPVLAVLLVQSSDTTEPPQLYRGTNMEVSMPTGSLCAERSAIGSALAANPNLKRQDLKLIAVLAVPPIEPMLETLTVEGRASLPKVHSFSSILVDPLEAEDRRVCTSRKSSIGSEYEPTTDEWILSEPHDPTNTSSCSSVGGDDVEPKEASSSLTEPLRRIALFYKTPSAARKSKRTVLVQSTKDINPLAPCGACNEWLKKIAESNPYFKIVTFTDANCNGIYVSPCQE